MTIRKTRHPLPGDLDKDLAPKISGFGYSIMNSKEDIDELSTRETMTAYWTTGS